MKFRRTQISDVSVFGGKEINRRLETEPITLGCRIGNLRISLEDAKRLHKQLDKLIAELENKGTT